MKNLLINPPGYSHLRPMGAEYPIGLLKLSSYLKSVGEEVDYFDFIPCARFNDPLISINLCDNFKEIDPSNYDQRNRELKCYKNQKFKIKRNFFTKYTGEYLARLGTVFPRIYNGADQYVFIDYLKNNPPDKIWISSGITYHYRGTVETIEICKEIYPDVPVVLGGIYPTLCHEHAIANTKADIIICGEYDNSKDFPMDYDILPNVPEYILRQFSKGCPNKCKFCAVSYLDGTKIRVVDIEKDVSEISEMSSKYGVTKVKLWGSNILLSGMGAAFEEWLDRIILLKTKYEIECPEGFSPELLTRRICNKIYKSGFRYIQIPIESGSDISLKDSMGKKYDVETWERAVNHAWNSGFGRDQIYSAIMYGMPEQTVEEVIETIRLISKNRVRALGRPYTPVPKSYWYENSTRFKNLDLEMLDGAIMPAITDSDTFIKFDRLSRYIVDNMSCEINNRKKEFLEEIDNQKEKRREEMISKEIVEKMATTMIDIFEQNEEILGCIKKLTEENKTIKSRLLALEESK
jgi:radical SAM superfamily enzyme YgiQ (UPF0313 family)